MLEAARDSGFDEDAVHHDFDGVIFAAVHGDGLVQRTQRAVHARAQKSIAEKFFQFLAIFAFASANDGREDHDAVVGGAEFLVQRGLHNLFDGLALDGLAAIGAMRRADGTVKHAQVVVNFSDGADGGTRRTRGGFLLDGDARRKSVDGVHVGAFHLIQKLARVSGKRLNIAALAFGVNRVKRERGFVLD